MTTVQRDPETHAALTARDAHKAPQRFYAEPSTPSAFATLGHRVECKRCEGAGALPVGEFGSYHRDGQTYDSPGMVVCEDCCGSGSLEAEPLGECDCCGLRGRLALCHVTGIETYACEECRGEERTPDDECDQGPRFDAPSERSMGRA